MRALALVLLLGCSLGDVVPSAAEQEAPAGSNRARAGDYEASRSRLEARRGELAKRLDRRRGESLARARALLVAALRDELLPAWDGTAWDFNGTSQVPRQGKIACGYFVSTALLHAGLRVERARLAQQASELIAKSLVSGPLRRTSDLPIDAFLAQVRAGGDGIYVVGLDNHVGFLIVEGAESWFHHAAPHEAVVRERAREAPYLAASRYRVAGKLFDDALVEKWLRGAPIATVVPQRR